jgi:type I restriction enzyme S subunit
MTPLYNDQALDMQGHSDDPPEGWVSAKLPEIAHINMGQSPPGRSYNNRGDGLPFFQGKADFGDRYPTVRVWCSQPKKIAQPGDVLISVRAPVGPTNVADRICAIGRGSAAMTPLGGIPSEFILFRLRLLEPELALTGTGSTFSAISRKDLEEIDIDVPPLAEQKRIVTKVEELLTRVNTTKERLAKVALILKRFGQAVLAAACSGRLTADWRENQNVLKEIGNIQDELSNMLPKSWTRAKLSQVTKINMGQSPPGLSYNERGDGLPFFQGKADFGDRYPTVRVWCNEPKKIAQPGDVLITIRAPVGPTNVANKICAIGRGLAAISPKEGMTSEFILFVLRLKEPELSLSGTGSTFTAIKRKDLEQIDINVPPITEQHEIVRRVEAMFKLADAIEKRVLAATARAEKLTRAILAKAFRGELVPNEAELARREARSYEPASELLARIKSERDAKQTSQKVRSSWVQRKTV